MICLSRRILSVASAAIVATGPRRKPGEGVGRSVWYAADLWTVSPGAATIGMLDAHRANLIRASIRLRQAHAADCELVAVGLVGSVCTCRLDC